MYVCIGGRGYQARDFLGGLEVLAAAFARTALEAADPLGWHVGAFILLASFLISAIRLGCVFFAAAIVGM